jgi:serine/threonine protein kinase
VSTLLPVVADRTKPRGRRVTSERFGPYELRDIVGRGAMGEVYRAHDTVRDRIVALKRLPADLVKDRSYTARFRRESELLARLREPHVIPIHDFGEIDGRLYIDMRLVEGIDLESLLQRDGPLAPARAVAMLEQVAGALDAAHHDGLVHRDVKPSNVLIDESGGREFVYLIDFGIARHADGSKLTASGALVGTATYMAPERFSGGGDHRVDVYAVGCLFYEMLTGEQPFPGDLPAQIYAHLHREPPRPSGNGTPVPAALDAVIARAMAKDPARRYPMAGELAADARRALVEVAAPVPNAPPPAPAPAPSAPPPAPAPSARPAAPAPPPAPRAEARTEATTRPVLLPTSGRHRRHPARRDPMPAVLGLVAVLIVVVAVVVLAMRVLP